MSELEQHRLLHLAAACGVVRQIVDRLRHEYTPEFHAAHLALPVFEDVRENAGWHAFGFARGFILKLGHRKTAELVLAGDYDEIRKRACEDLHCEELGCREAHMMTAELRGLTDDERLELVDHNRKMHLAIVIGYIRCTLARIGSEAQRENSYKVSLEHLERPEFASLPASLLDWIKMEICEFWKDGMLNDAKAIIAAARAGNHEFFWKMESRAVSAGVPIDPVPIIPEMLLLDARWDQEAAKKEENVLFHLALAVGYARLGRHRMAAVDAVTALVFAQAHLERAPFSGLPENLRKIVSDEIHSLAHDGSGTPDQGVALIEAVAASKYGPCLRLANERLQQREPGYPPVIAMEIDPAWLL